MDIWNRTRRLIGEAGLATLQHSHVAVIGLGGVGGAAAEALVRAGVGKVTLMDNDVIQASNLNRQLPALHSTIGQLKTSVMLDRLTDIAPTTTLRALPHFYLPNDDGGLFDDSIDFVVDAIDNMTAKIDLIWQCHLRQIAIISSLGMGNRLAPELINITDLSKTHTDPLARILRQKLGKLGVKHLPVVFSSEVPTKPEPDASAEMLLLGKNPPASISFVPPVAGYMAASYVVRRLLEKSDTSELE